MKYHTLLSAEEEQSLGRLIQNGQSSSATEAERIAAAAAEAEMIEHNIALAMNIARRWTVDSPQYFDDTFGAALIGLLQAARAFDPDRGARFSTVAHFWMHRQITHEWQQTRNPIPLKFHVAQARLTLEKGKQLLRNPKTPEERERFLAATNVGTRVVRFADLRGHWNEPVDPNPGVDIDRDDEIKQRLAKVRAALWHLESRQRHILIRHNGLDNRQSETLAEIALRLGVSKGWTRELYRQSLENLATILATNPVLTATG